MRHLPVTSPAAARPPRRDSSSASRVAAAVRRAPAAGQGRSCACGGTCPRCQHTHHDTSADTTDAVRAAQGSRGAALDAATRATFEPRFGHDLRDVRVHSTGPAAETARGYGARAFTVGRDIVFSPGQYHPQTETGRRLIAHELAHVAQGRHRHAAGSSVSDAERDASNAAERALHGMPATVHARASVAAPLFQMDWDPREDEARRRRGLIRYARPRFGPPRYWDKDRQGREGSSPVFHNRSATEAIVQGCVSSMRPRIPEWYDTDGMSNFDCRPGLWGEPGQFDFRGRVMASWEANYYFVSMAMAHQGWDWSEAQAIIIAWNVSQDLGLNDYGGAGEMTDELWFAAHEGFNDELRRMAVGQ